MSNSELSMRTPKPLRWVAPLCAAIGLAGVMLYCGSLWTLASRGTTAEPVLTTPSRTGNSQRGGLESLAALKPGIPSKNQVAEQYVKLPLSFESNRGQSDSRVKFLARGNGYALFLTPSEAVFALSKSSNASVGKTIATRGQRDKNQSAAVLRMSLHGANPAPRLAALEELPGKSNYFIGNKPSGWHTSVPNYRKVAEREVYPGIDLIYYGTQRQLEYDFVVAPGADARLIQLVFHGAKQLRTDAQGELVVSVAGGEVVLHKPVAYQDSKGVRQPVAAEFAMKGARTIAFRMGKYDPRLPVVIDPILSYSTYLGGSDIDVANGIAVASDGTAFVVGSTHSINFPTTHSLQPNHGGGDDFPQDAFVTKLSADGKTLLYSTYLGGENQDSGNGIAVDSFGNAYVVGTTFSPHFPVTLPVFDAGCGGDGRCGATFNTEGAIVSNAFVAKLNTAGSALIYSTFLGNYEDVTGTAIAVDADGNAYVTGQTTPMIDPTVTITPPAPAPEPFPIVGGFKGNTVANGFVGITNAYIAKFSPSGISLLYSSYIGGTSEDSGIGVAADSSGNAYVTGLANSTDFPVLGALQITKAGAGDAFLTKVNTTLTGIASLSYSTFIGGTGQDQGNGVAVDPTGKAYVVGTTKSVASTLGFTPPSGAVQPNCDVPPSPAPPAPPSTCQGDAFIAKFDTTATDAASLTYFTYLGGTLADQGNGIAFDTNGNAYVVGTTVSQDFPTTTPVFQPKYGGGNADAFITKLNATASTLVYSSYLGGTNTESGNGIAIEPNPADPTNPGAFVTGQTCSLDFPLSNPAQATPAGNCDAFISKVIVSAQGIALNPAGLIFPGQAVNSTSSAQTVTLNNGDSVLSITSVSITGTNAGDFAQTNTCGNSVVAGGTCSFSITFTPTAAGSRNAQLSIQDNAPGSPHVVNLSGTGNPSPTVSVAPSSLAFGNQSVGSTSASQSITVSNTGTAALTFSGITASGAFSQTNDCNTPLQPTTNCVINVTFTPTAAGANTGALTLTDNAPDSPQIFLLTGTGVIAPIATVSPKILGFAPQGIGTFSTPQTIALTNTGSGPLVITSIAATGDFFQVNTCGPSLPANTGCAISVTFAPTATGQRTGTVTITDNSPTSPETVALSGTGGPNPGISFAPLSLVFGNQPVGTTSTAQAITVTNTGANPLAFTSITTNSAFSQTNNCTLLLTGNNCVVNVTFSPIAGGPSSGALIFVDNAADTPQSVQTLALTGTGVGGPTISFSPASLSFGNQAVGTSSTPQAVTISNTGGPALAITSIVASGAFSQTSNCGSSLQGGSNCVINVTFFPTATGPASGTLVLTDNAPASPQNFALGGSGIAPAVALSPASLTFGNQAVGTTSTAQTVTVANTGAAPLEISNIVASGAFSQTNNCTAALQPGANCVINVTFVPTAAGPSTGGLVLTDNAPNSPQSLVLTGTGLTTPLILLAPTSLSFGNQPVGTSSTPQTVTVTNTGGPGLSFISIVANGAFSQTNSCTGTLQSGDTCVINVTFTPTATGASTGSLVFTDNAPASPQSVVLTGTGLPGPAISFAPASVTFGNQAVGTTSPAQAVTITNTGGPGLTFTSIVASGAFAQTNTCTSPLQSNANCVINITFTPTAAGPTTGSLTLTDNAPNSPQSLVLTGTGLAPVVSFAPASLTFGNQPVGTSSTAQPITVSNTGGAPLVFTSIAASGEFAQSNSCGATLAPNSTCTINVTYSPAAAGPSSGAITVGDNTANSPHVLSLTGTGLATPTISLSAVTLTFGNQAVGTTSTPQTVTVTNTGGPALTFASIVASGAFSQTNNCGAPLQANTNCVINITFSPLAAGASTGALTLVDNAPNSPQVLTLTGTGLAAPGISFAPASLSFGNQSVGSTSAPQPVTVSNTGGSALTFAGIAASGAFSQTNNCSVPLQPNTNCVINVTFSPTAAGASAGALTLTDNAPNSPQSLPLNGNGLVQPVATLSATNLGFAAQTLGSTSPAQGVTLSNTGSGPLVISSIVATGDFIQSNNCGSSLPVNANCAIGVVFVPTAVGNRSGTIQITDNAPGSPQVITLSGTGTPAPGISFTPTSLAFGNQPVGVTSSPKSIVVTNIGQSALGITSVTASGDFAQVNTCGSPLPPTTTCTIVVTYTPASQGSSSGSITVSDNAPGSPHVVLLSGTGSGVNADFSITPSANSATVPAGQGANFGIAITSINSFSQQVTLSCSGLPVDSSCSMSPQSVTPTPGGTANFNLTVHTGLRTFVAPGGRARKIDPFGALRHLSLPWFAFLILFSLTLAKMSSLKGRRLPVAACGMLLSLVLMAAACSGGGAAGTPVGTPAGTYQVVVTASSTGASGSITHTTTLTLKVN